MSTRSFPSNVVSWIVRYTSRGFAVAVYWSARESERHRYSPMRVASGADLPHRARGELDDAERLAVLTVKRDGLSIR